jgi:hypothetical protein
MPPSAGAGFLGSVEAPVPEASIGIPAFVAWLTVLSHGRSGLSDTRPLFSVAGGCHLPLLLRTPAEVLGSLLGRSGPFSWCPQGSADHPCPQSSPLPARGRGIPRLSTKTASLPAPVRVPSPWGGVIRRRRPPEPEKAKVERSRMKHDGTRVSPTGDPRIFASAPSSSGPPRFSSSRGRGRRSPNRCAYKVRRAARSARWPRSSSRATLGRERKKR